MGGGGPSGHYEPDGPTCGGAAHRPTVSVNTNTHSHTDGGTGLRSGAAAGTSAALLLHPPPPPPPPPPPTTDY